MAGWTVPGYTETGVLGTGEAGRVVGAVHDRSGVRVAITYPDPKLCSDPVFRERIRADTDLLTALDHPNVVRVRALVETGTEVALITDAVEGAALRRVLASSGPLSAEAALAVMRGSLLGLGAAHEAGVVHRDYQPSNVMIGTDGAVKVTGFGLAVRNEGMTPAPGTPPYTAPELWEGAAPRAVTDLYAVTATFYECLTGRVPYAAESVFELQTMHRAAPIPVADVPAAVGPLVAQGLAKAPVERPGDAAGFVAELEAAAVVEFGLEWEERGRRELAALVAALPDDEVVGGEAAAGGVAASGTVADEVGAGDATQVLPVGPGLGGSGLDDGRFGGGGLAGGGGGGGHEKPAEHEGMGRGTKVGISVAAVVVIGAVVAAVGFSPGKHASAATGPSDEIVSVPSDQGSSTDGGSPGVAAGARPTTGALGVHGSSSATVTASGGPTPATPGGTTVATSGATATATAIGLPLPTLTASEPLPSYPSGPRPSTSAPTTPGSSSAPPTSSSSVAVSVTASATMTKDAYSGPCPPTDPPTGTVTFTVGGLPTGGTLPISYHWHVAGSGGTGSGSGGTADGSGSGQVDAHDGANTQSFTVTLDPHSQKGLSGTVEITWSAPGTPGGTTSAGSVDITCTPSGASSGDGPTTTSGS